MALRAGINGFGRIGRNVFRAAHARGEDIDWVGVNDITDTETLAHLLKYDSILGPFPGEVEATENGLIVDGDELRDLTGLDDAVIEYVEGSDGISAFYERLTPLLDYLLPAYEREGKAHLTVGIGCTGGRHRSVVIAEHLARTYEQRDDLLIDVVHRDVDKPPRRP